MTTTLALIVVTLTQGVVALSARERWAATRNLSSSGDSVLTTTWFTATMVVVLVVSVIALVVVRLYKKVVEHKAAEKELSDNAARKRPLDRARGGELVEPLTGPEKVSSAASSGGGLADVAEKPASDPSTVLGAVSLSNRRRGDSGAGETAFIAMFPFEKKIDLINGGGRKRPQQGYSPPGLSKSLPEFMPATVTGLVGRVLFIETTLSAGVGDRVLVVIGQKGSEYDETLQLIEDIGIIEQSTQPAGLLTEPNACRLGVVLAGLSDTQAVQLAAIIGAKTQEMAKQMMLGGSKEGPK
jgi:hypothetical protein